MTYGIYLKDSPVSPCPDFQGTSREASIMRQAIEQQEPRLRGKLEVVSRP